MHPRLSLAFLVLAHISLCLWAGVGAAASNLQLGAFADPSLGLTPVEVRAGGAGLPKNWKFFPVSPTGDLPTGQANVAISLDPISGTVSEIYREGDVEVREPLVLTPDQYNQILTGRTVHKLWRERSEKTRSVVRGQARGGGLFRVELPVQFPKMIRSIVGDGAPNIEVSGSETITLSGTSNWIASNQIQTDRKQQSAFPTLDMKQELNVNLTGSIGDKIKIDVDQSSNVVTSIDNKVKLRYEGGEDDMIRSVELGNTNLSVEGASFRQEGLFGIKTVAKLGNVDLTTIASKQQGKTETARFTPSGDLKQVIVTDLSYIRRMYFFLADHPVRIDRNSIYVFKDDRTSINNNGVKKGVARLDPGAPADSQTNPETQGNFTLLTPDVDYSIITPWIIDGGTANLEIPIIQLRTALGESEVLAVAYKDEGSGTSIPVGTVTQDTLLAKMIKPASNAFTIKDDVFDPAEPWYPALFYEIRNFYDLGGRDIALETLSLRVRRIQLGQTSDPEAVDGVPLIQILGLDQRSRAGSVNQDAPDGKVDEQYIDPRSGILFFPDLHPFDPDTTDTPACGPKIAGFNCLDNYGRNILRRGSLNAASESNINVYYRSRPDPLVDTRYYLEAEFKSSQQGFFLGRYDILEGSDQVKVDGIPKQRGTDYNIDYSTGQLTFINLPGPEQTISVDFSFAPGAGSTQLTLLGASASYVPGPNFSLTSSLLYDSRGAQETNPKLGEEPARTIIGDVSSIVAFRPVWMTQLANVIPGVRTNSPSTLNIQARASMSLPNPNTAGEAYLDDMEGNRESNTVGLGRTQWFWSSIPIKDTADLLSPAVPRDVSEHDLLEWFNPHGPADPDAVKEHDLKPVLKKEEGGDAERTVLELNIKRPTGDPPILPSNWTGLTQSLSTVGQDFSKVRYMEIWINDFALEGDHSLTDAKLHLNFGRVSEDAFWRPDTLPNLALDTEDQNGDGRLDVDEDTGLDGIPDIEEPGISLANPDPNKDDYYFDSSLRPPDYSQFNNFEKNSTGIAGARPDTEDLNRDGFADFRDDYFEATIDLSDTAFVAIDVFRDYAADPAVPPNTIKAGNGWRLFRIPITAQVFERVGSPSWEDIEHMRVWVNGMSRPLKIQIGGIELVGNRWLAQAIDSTATARGVAIGVGARNNKDDAGYYDSPYDVENTVGGTATRREQSLAIRFTGLERGDSVLAFKTSGDGAGGLGWTQYRQIRFWVHGETGVESQDLRVLARFGPDTVNYYEYSAPIRSGWQSVVIPMEYLSAIKAVSDTARVRVDSLTAASTGEFYTVSGNPSFTRILRTSFGVASRSGTPIAAAGEVWINDLRLADVLRDKGIAGDFTVQANFADVIAMNLSYQNQDEDFFRVGTGLNQGSGLNHVATSFSTTFQLDRVMPTSGVQLPVRFSIQHASDVPKFRTGSDVILSESRSSLETREQNRQSIDLSYRRTGLRKGVLRYTLDALSGAMAYSRAGSVNQTSKDSSWTFNASTGYDLPVGGGGFGLGSRMKVNLLPDVIGFTTAWQSSRSVSYGRKLLEDSDTTALRSDVQSRVLTLGGSSSWTPLSSVRFRYSITSVRNMLLHEEAALGFNKGTQIDQSRRLELNYTPRWLSAFSPNVSLNGRYHESSRPELRILSGDPAGLKNVDNGGSARVTAMLPLGRLAQKFSPRPGVKPGTSKNPLMTPVRTVVSKLQDIQGSLSFDRSTAISRVVGDAGTAFETGFTQSTSGSLTRLNNSVFTSNRAYTSGANTSIRPTASITIDVRGDHRLTYSDASVGARRQLSRSLPDLKGSWRDLQQLMGLQKLLSSMTVNSAYNHRLEETGPQDGPVEQHTNTTSWQPLLGWDVVWRSGLRANVSTTVVQALSVDDRLFGVAGDRQTVNTDVRFSKTFPASRGIRFPWNKNPIKLPNDLNLNLTFTAASDRKSTRQPGTQGITEINNERLSLISATNYNFTQSISGGFNLGFNQSKDLKTNVTTRGITIAFNGQFRF